MPKMLNAVSNQKMGLLQDQSLLVESSPSHNWLKAGIVFVAGTLGFIGLKWTGGLSVLSSWFGGDKTDTTNVSDRDVKSIAFANDINTARETCGSDNIFALDKYENKQDVKLFGILPPVLGNNMLNLERGGSGILTNLNLNASDLDDTTGSLIFKINELQHLKFARINNTLVAINNFTQQEVSDRQINFFHDNSTIAPYYTVSVSDGISSTEPKAVAVEFSTIEFALNGSEFKVNNYTLNDQEFSSATSLTDGKFVIVWQSLGQDVSDAYDEYSIYRRIYNSDHSPAETEILVNSHANRDQKYPSIAGLSDGKFVVVWVSSHEAGPYGVYGQIYYNNGTTYGSEFNISSNALIDQKESSVAALSNEKFVVVWTRYISDQDIYGQIYCNNGTQDGSKFLVNTYITSSQFEPSITGLFDGKFVVVWNSFFGTSNEIYGQKFYSNGSKWDTEFRVNTYTNNDQIKSSITTLSDGKFVVVWQSLGQDASGSYGIYGQMYDDIGKVFGTEFLANTRTLSDQKTPSVAGLMSGKFIVTWASKGQDAGLYDYGIYGQLYNNDGTKLRTEFRINTYTELNQVVPYVASISNGYLVTWTSSGQDLSSTGIYAQAYESIIDRAPVLKNNTLIIKEGETVNITSAVLYAEDLDLTNNDKLNFNVIDVQAGKFVYANNPSLPITSFTQQKVLDGVLQFIHDGKEFPPSYKVSIDDGLLGTVFMPARVIFMPVNNGPVLINNRLAIVEGQTIGVNITMLSANDTDTADTNITFTISNQFNGYFQLASNPGNNISSFTQQQIKNNAIQFVHTGIGKNNSCDTYPPSYQVTVSDGVLTDGPRVVNLTSFNSYPRIINNELTIQNSESVTLNARFLNACDNETNADELLFIVGDSPQHGHFYDSAISTPITSFNQSRIKINNIIFYLDGTCNKPYYDISVSDGSLTAGPFPANVIYNNDNNCQLSTLEKMLIVIGSIVGVVGIVGGVAINKKVKKIKEEIGKEVRELLKNELNYSVLTEAIATLILNVRNWPNNEAIQKEVITDIKDGLKILDKAQEGKNQTSLLITSSIYSDATINQKDAAKIAKIVNDECFSKHLNLEKNGSCFFNKKITKLKFDHDSIRVDAEKIAEHIKVKLDRLSPNKPAATIKTIDQQKPDLEPEPIEMKIGSMKI
jgi:hypothetical protein